MLTSRRNFLKDCGGLAAVAALPDFKFPTDPRQRIAVASYPFRAFIDAPRNRDRERGKPGMPLTGFAHMVVVKFGVHAIEPLDAHFASTEPAYLKQLRTSVEKAGAHIVNIPVDLRDSVYDPDDAARARAVQTARKWIDAASAVGSPGVRVHVARTPRSKPDVDRAAASLKEVAAYSAPRNIIVSLENDDLVSEDAFFLVKVIEKVNSPYLRALPDFCNSMLSGDEGFNYAAVEAMFRHATNIAHVKDSEAPGGRVYRVDVARTFAIAKKAGYRGYFSMEWEGEGGPYEGTASLIEQTLAALQRSG
ncbi:MAG TPA: sugar phosphate isomerase/epimerase family protein [Bryobacteraceae bacterium]|nr:sugar phosphate isomerase/epimerase family protein [Bryobacteraceae bacterium]